MFPILRKLTKDSTFLTSNSPTTSNHGFNYSNFSSQLCSLWRRRERRWICGQQMRLLNGISLPLSRPLYHTPHSPFHCFNGQVPSFLSHSLSLSLSQQKLLNSTPQKSHFSTMGKPLTSSKVCSACFGGTPFGLELNLRRKMSTLLSSRVANGYLEVKEGKERGFDDIGMSLIARFDSFGVIWHSNWSLDMALRRNMLRASQLNLSSKHCLRKMPFYVSPSNWSLVSVLRRKVSTLGFSDFNCRRFSSVADVDSDIEGEKEENEDDDGGGGSADFKSTADPKEVERVCKVIEELFALDRNMEGVLDQCGIELSHDFVVDVLARFQHARRPAFRFFSWAGEKSDFEHDSRTYNSMMRILGKTRQFESMIGMLEEMGKKGVLTIETFSIAIRAFAAEREMKKVMGMFELMKRHNFKTGVDTYNCLLDALGRAKLGKEAQGLFEKLKNRFTPDLKTYSVLLAGWCKVKNLIEAGKVWNVMIDMGMKPDIVTHNIMLEGLLKGRRNSEAIKFFELMKAKGPSPNVRSYTILIRDLCKANKMEEAVEYFDEMLDAGCTPDPAVYTCLMVGFGNQKKMHEVYGLLKEMKEKGCPPDGRTYNALIKLMTNQQMPDNAVRVYKKMIQSGYQPTIHTYNMMMKSYFQMKNYEMGSAVWEEMLRKGCCPDDNSYTVFIGGLIKVGRSEEACKYIEEMLEKGMKSPQLDYNKFAADYSRAGKPNILEELAQKMKFSGKFEEANVFARWYEMTKKPVKQKEPGKVRRRFT